MTPTKKRRNFPISLYHLIFFVRRHLEAEAKKKVGEKAGKTSWQYG
jgi:hypothetical protein